MKIKNKKYSVILCSILLFSINLTACNKQQKEYIEVGLSDDYDHMIMNPWNEFHTGLKVKTKKDKIQDIEVFYGNQVTHLIDLYNPDARLNVDLNQKLEFKLTRYIYFCDNDVVNGQVAKSKDILVKRKTLEYFFSEEFSLYRNSIIDTIGVEDLVQDYDEYGVINYKFDISPIENEELKLYRYSNENPDELAKIYLDDKIRSYFNWSIDYTIDENNKISFIEGEKIKENVNV